MPKKQTASQMDPCRQVLYACLNNLLNKQAENTNKSGFMEGQGRVWKGFFLLRFTEGYFRQSIGKAVKQPRFFLYLIYRDILLSVIKTALNLLNTRWQPP